MSSAGSDEWTGSGLLECGPVTVDIRCARALTLSLAITGACERSDAKPAAAPAPTPVSIPSSPPPDEAGSIADPPTPPAARAVDAPDLDDEIRDVDLEALPPPPPTERYIPPSTTDVVAAAHPDNRETCEVRWPVMRRSSGTRDRTCARFWVIHHGYGGRTDGLDLDPVVGGTALVKLGSRTLLRLARRVRAYCGVQCQGVDQRAIELFETSASYHYRLREVNPDAPDLVPLLRVLLAGKPVAGAWDDAAAPDADEVEIRLARLSPMSLVRLRNAPYARHGRTFKSPDLQSFFYDQEPAYLRLRDPRGLVERGELGLFPQTVDPDYTDAALTPVDHANIAVIRRAEKR